MSGESLTLLCYSPAGVLARPAALKLAIKRLRGLGFEASADPSATARFQRFAGDDDARLAAIHRVADAAPSIALATRGGYGTTRLLPRIDWKRVERSIERGTRWVGHSDSTVFQMALLARGRIAGRVAWAGPHAVDHFGQGDGRDDGDATEAVDEVTAGCFCEAMRGELEAMGFRTESGFDGLDVRGRLWGGNLAMLASLLGTPYWPAVRGGVLFVEEVNEHPYRVERVLLQLHQAGVLAAQKAVLIGQVTAYKASPLDRGYTLKTAIAHLRSVCKTPILTGLPFGHVPTIVTLPVGARVTLATQGGEAFIGW